MVYGATKASKMGTHVHCIHYHMVLTSILLVERWGAEARWMERGGGEGEKSSHSFEKFVCAWRQAVVSRTWSWERLEPV